jgi:hypothetical protein
MMLLELGKWCVARRGVSQLAIAVVLSSAACGSSGDDDAMNNNGLLGSGGTAANMVPIGAGGMTAVGGSGKGAAGMGMTPPPGTGGKGTAGMGGTGGVAPAPGTGGMPAGTGGMMATGDGGIPPVVGNGESACLDGDTDYEADGKFKFTTMDVGAVHFWVPDVPAGCKVPVIHLANGTGATCSAYGPALERMASHGFLTCCYEDPNTGAGDQGVMAFDAAFMMFPDLAAHALGSTGHSQGGQAAFTVLSLAEDKFGDSYIYAGLAMEPASGFGTQPSGGTWASLYEKINSPMFMFSAVGSDGLVSQGWVQQAYDAMNPATEVYFWAKNGATHIPVPNGEEQEISIPWFRWKLLGDQKACAFFKSIPMTITGWQVVATENEKQCM